MFVFVYGPNYMRRNSIHAKKQRRSHVTCGDEREMKHFFLVPFFLLKRNVLTMEHVNECKAFLFSFVGHDEHPLSSFQQTKFMFDAISTPTEKKRTNFLYLLLKCKFDDVCSFIFI